MAYSASANPQYLEGRSGLIPAVESAVSKTASAYFWLEPVEPQLGAVRYLVHILREQVAFVHKLLGGCPDPLQVLVFGGVELVDRRTRVS